MTKAVVVLCTCSGMVEARKLAHALVDERLAACVNVIPGIESVYRWEGQIEQANEILLVIKTTAERLATLESSLAELHSYDTPEILALPVIAGSKKYLSWLDEQVS
jgi:periplasmic divalent cation tolerance protein